MKKTLILLSVLMVALAFGTAYADSKDMKAGEYNGIMVYEMVTAPSHDVGSGLALENGITAFDVRPVAWSEGSAAGGLSSTELSRELRNGITVF